MAAPHVYTAISRLVADLAKSGVAKNHRNERDDYKYRSIDDILDRLSPLLAAHRLCVLPRVLDRTVLERSDEAERLVVNVTLRVMFTIVSADDGSSHVVEAFGEALDAGDKATAKAMSAAYKSAMIQTFCMPVCGAEDTEASSYRICRKTHPAEPVGGWEQWAEDIAVLVLSCESAAAIDHVQSVNRELLKAISRERADLYSELGRVFSDRRTTLDGGVHKKNRTSKQLGIGSKIENKVGLELHDG